MEPESKRDFKDNLVQELPILDAPQNLGDWSLVGGLSNQNNDFLQLSYASEFGGTILKHRFLGLRPKDSSSACFAQGPHICNCEMLPGDADPCGQDTTVLAHSWFSDYQTSRCVEMKVIHSLRNGFLGSTSKVTDSRNRIVTNFQVDPQSQKPLICIRWGWRGAFQNHLKCFFKLHLHSTFFVVQVKDY